MHVIEIPLSKTNNFKQQQRRAQLAVAGKHTRIQISAYATKWAKNWARLFGRHSAIANQEGFGFSRIKNRFTTDFKLRIGCSQTESIKM